MGYGLPLQWRTAQATRPDESGYAPVTNTVEDVPREQVIEVVAEMVANVLSVSVEPGDDVAVGDTVALLESMKMEIPVIADRAGTVTAVKVTAGDVVQEGDVLVALSAG